MKHIVRSMFLYKSVIHGPWSTVPIHVPGCGICSTTANIDCTQTLYVYRYIHANRPGSPEQSRDLGSVLVAREMAKMSRDS